MEGVPLSESRKLIWEGIAIVVSILLAFAIDAWWDYRQLRAEEQQVLVALRQDFLANRAEARSRAGTAALEPDSATATLLALAAPRTFDAVRGTLDALIGSGRPDLIRDAELRHGLTVFLNLAGDSEEDAR